MFGGPAGSEVPQIELPDGRQIERPHLEWYMHQLRWRWLLDSWEGGEAYRTAVYGFDTRHMPIRNLIRHKREYPATSEQSYSMQSGRPPGSDPATQATDDDYELRRARTPVPGFVAEVVETHLSKIFKREVSREGPAAIEEWWEDIDGKGTMMDQWMSEVVAPLLLVLGQLDIILDHPPRPDREEIRSRADERRFGLDRVVASYILPENMVWWNLDSRGRYEDCLVKEVRDDMGVIWRYWCRDFYASYDAHGEMVGDVTDHPYGAVPIVRLFDRRRPRCRHIGLPRYEGIAEIQREYYNRDSELILSDTTQAHPLLQGPEDYVQPDGTIPIGPNWLLPKKKNTSGGAASYEGFDVVVFPKEGADSIRTNKHDLREAVDRAAALTKPAGSMGTDANSVAQSGISKRLDTSTGNDLLSKIAQMLGRNEKYIADLFWFVLGNGKPDEAGMEATNVQYPMEFDLLSADELADLTGKYQLIINSGGRSPVVEQALIDRLLKQALAGLDDDQYKAMSAEVEEVLAEGPPEPVVAMPPEGQQQQPPDDGDEAQP